MGKLAAMRKILIPARLNIRMLIMHGVAFACVALSPISSKAQEPTPQSIKEQTPRGGAEVREFLLVVPQQDNPLFYSALLTNSGLTTATFSMTFNGLLYQSSEDVCAAIAAMSPEYPSEPVYRKAWRFIRDRRYHYRPLTEIRWQHAPPLFLNSIGFGYCDDSASLLNFLWRRMGYEARVWEIGGHVISEVLVDGRWEMYDAGLPCVSENYDNNYRGLQQCVYYHNRAGQVAGVEELAADGTLITKPRSPINPRLKTSNRYYCYSSNIALLYTSTNDNSVQYWYMWDEPGYTLSFQIPPGGCLSLPGYFTNELRVIEGYPAPPLMATALLNIPPGYSGTLDNRLVIHSFRGHTQDTVRILGREFYVGSTNLQAFIDDRTNYFSALTFTQTTACIEVVYLLNAMLIEMQYSNVLRLTGTQLGGIVAETRNVTPYLKYGDFTAGDAGSLNWSSSARYDYALQVSTNMMYSAWSNAPRHTATPGTGGRMSVREAPSRERIQYYRLNAIQR